MEKISLPTLIVFSILGIFAGFFIMAKPSIAIEIQRKFYEKINWKIEPISMQKEIRNTRIMGWILAILSLATLSYILYQ